MVLVTSNKPRRLLFLSFIGDVVPAHFQASLPDVVTLLAELPAGCRVLTDFTQLDTMHPDCATYIGQVMDLCDQKDVSQVLRVIPDPTKDIGMNILTIFHYRHRPIFLTCKTMPEADAQLKQ